MDWAVCVICGGGGELKCPANSLQGNASEVYQTFSNLVREFREIGELPTSVNFIKQGFEVEAKDLLENRAKWHKSCHLKFAQSKLDRVKKRQAEQATQVLGSSRKKRRSDEPKVTCLFCEHTDGVLHECSTFQMDQNLKDMATAMGDTVLLGKLCSGDVIAQELKYHLDCLTAFRNRYRATVRRDSSREMNEDKQLLEGRCFAELVSHITDKLGDGQYIFQLQDLHTLYETRRNDLGVGSNVNRTRLKDQLLSHFRGQCQEQSSGRNRMLVFREGLGDLLKEEIQRTEKDALAMVQMAKQIRKDIFDKPRYTFEGSFTPQCQSTSIPRSLINLVSLLLNGTDIEDQDAQESQSCLSIAQLICFNAKKKAHKTQDLDPKCRRTNRSREMPLPLYLGIKLHTQSRNKILIEQLHSLGLSVNYKRVLQIEQNLARSVAERYHTDGIVCPMNLRKGLYTVGAIDNLDHNPSSQTAKGSFHGTGISIFQVATETNQGESRGKISFNEASGLLQLPEEFSVVPAVAFSVSHLKVPERMHVPDDPMPIGHDVLHHEKEWLHNALSLLQEDQECDDKMCLTWSAYHSGQQRCNTETTPGLGALLPLFQEKAATFSMIKHGIDVLKKITEYLNPEQVPVLACDQPLFALVKYVQWTRPDSYGENRLIPMLGGLHTEINFWKLVGNLLDESGWTTMLNDSGVATSGRADSYIHASHLKRTRHSHQVTALALAQLELEAFEQLRKDGEDRSSWKIKMEQKSPTFHFWQLILELELLGLAFVRSHRERNFEEYVKCLREMVPWWFALDHPNYSRWVAVHICDMESLPYDLREELKQGWTFSKTSRQFSSMPLDQAHEQHNAIVKGSGGAVGLTENPIAFNKWMVAGPEQARLVMEFEKEFDENTDEVSKHLEAGAGHQRDFKEEVSKVANTMKVMGNPFLEEGPELLALHSHECFPAVAESMSKIRNLGKEKYQQFKETVLKQREVPLNQAIKRNNLHLFKNPGVKAPNKNKKTISNLKQNCNLFSRLYISSQVRSADMDVFFKYENVQYPPSLSDNGDLRLPTKKSDLLECLDSGQIPDAPVQFDATIVDGATVVHSLPTAHVKTFHDYAEKVFLPWIYQRLERSTRLDVIWDTYCEGSLKETTRRHRGKGSRRKVSSSTKLPSNFPAFLRESKNKEEFFQFLTDVVIAECTLPDGKELQITDGLKVTSLGGRHSDVDVSGHEEADTKIVSHTLDALRAGHKTVVVTTVDTDVVIILLGMHHLTTRFPDADIWVGFGPKKSFRYYHIKTLYNDWGSQKCRAMPFFHALTGSDTTSQFLRHGKKAAWKTWATYQEANEAFAIPASNPFVKIDVMSKLFQCVERFVCLLYQPSTDLSSVNDQRRELFSKKGKQIDALPPTQAALLQHVRRAVYQASLWSCSATPLTDIPSPEEYGWRKDETGWTPHWSDLPEAAKACRELLRCCCKALPLCTKKCRCHEAGLGCTTLCACEGDCDFQINY